MTSVKLNCKLSFWEVSRGLMVGNFIFVKTQYAICEYKSDDSPPQMTIIYSLISMLMHCFTFSPFKLYYICTYPSAFSNVKPVLCQSEAMFYIEVEFVTVYNNIYGRNLDVIQTEFPLYS